MTLSNYTIENSQFTLYYMLMAADGIVTDHEKDVFLKVITKEKKYTNSYAGSVLRGKERFASMLNVGAVYYKNAIDALKNSSEAIKDETVSVLRELSFADKDYNKKEMEFIFRVRKDLGLE